MRTTPKGRRFRARFKVKGKVVVGSWLDSEDRARDQLAEMRKSRDVIPGELLTLGRAMQLVTQDLRDRNKRPATIVYHTERFDILRRHFPESTPMRRITADRIEGYVGKRTGGDDAVSVATVKGDLRALSACIHLAIRKGCLASNPIKGARLPETDDPRQDWFTRDELGSVLARIRSWETRDSRLNPSMDADIIEFLALTGARKREAADLRVGDVSLRRGAIEIVNGKRGSRTVRVKAGSALHAVTRRLLGGRERFAARRGDPLLAVAYAGLGSMLRRWADRLRCPDLHCHSLRHTYLTEVARRTRSPFQVMKAGGLRSVVIAQRYIHLAGVDLDDSVAEITYHDEPPRGRADAPS